MCKRPCFHDEYLQCFNKPNVTLVDVSKGGGADAFTPKGIVAYGKEYEVDCIIIGTPILFFRVPPRKFFCDEKAFQKVSATTVFL